MNKNVPIDLDLVHLPEKLKKAAQEFVELKYQLDCKGRYNPDYIPDDLYGMAHSGDYSSVSGWTFFINIMPFVPAEKNERQIKYIPVEYTLGCSWRWWPEHAENDKDKIIDFINNLEQAQSTSYTFISNLGIVLASEGKNRINFCRYHGIPKIPGNVDEVKYPEAERIIIYKVDTYDDYFGCKGIKSSYLAVLDDRYIQVIEHIDYALPLLREYGVNIANKWPESFPELMDIDRFAAGSLSEYAGRRKSIDMEKVNAYVKKEKEGEETQKLSILDMKIKNKLFVLSVSILLLIVCFILFVEFRDGYLAQLFCGLLGMSISIFIMMVMPVFIVKKKYKDNR
ncbi:hypothetical protein ITJ98_004413 [Escherichia coli]|nr:hypothetical protein [Escherichia coli]EGO0802808.1 hypothetical protein [Escherichia coli]EIW5406387.1 hypothetical protein [Escherichia coli]